MSSRPLVIAHVCLQRGYYPYLTQVELLMRSLADLGVLQILVCRDDNILHLNLRNIDGIKFIIIKGSIEPKFRGHLKLLKKADVIHSHDVAGNNWTLIHYIMFGVPYIITVRASIRDKFVPNCFNGAVYAWAKSVVATQPALVSETQSLTNRTIGFVPDSSSNQKPLDTNLGFLKKMYKGRFVIGCVADLISRLYGQSVLIEAMKILSSQIPEALCVFIGSGDDLGVLRDAACNLPNIKFLGHQRNQLDYICAMDVLVYPVNQEGDTGFILSAMENRIPIIATTIGTLPSLLKFGEAGILIPPKDPNALADAILTIKRDHILRESIKENGWQVAQSFNPLFMAEDYFLRYKGAFTGTDS